MLILVTNDDGITSNGIRTLVNTVKSFGEVVVVAPDSPQSGMGHAITVDSPLWLRESHLFGDEVKAWECSGTPADCVKLAKHEVLQGRKIDLVVSGINHGSNTAISVIYSGTMSAAVEAALEHIPAIGFSLVDFDHEAEIEHVVPHLQEIVQKVIDKGIPNDIALNVNFPAASQGPIKGLKICRQANAKWVEKFDARKSPFGRPYYWMSGEFQNFDHGTDNDEGAVRDGYVAIVPVHFDMTAYQAVRVIHEKWKL